MGSGPTSFLAIKVHTSLQEQQKAINYYETFTKTGGRVLGLHGNNHPCHHGDPAAKQSPIIRFYNNTIHRQEMIINHFELMAKQNYINWPAN